MRNYPDFLNCLTIIPTGENRFSYLYSKPGYNKQLFQAVEKYWCKDFSLYSSRDVVYSGLFGTPIHSKLWDRIGDTNAIAHEKRYWWWAQKKNTLLGRHGGLSEDEMLVPFIAKVL